MKTRTLVGLTVLDIILVFILWTMLRVDAMVEEVPATCPAGSYEIGRKEPDGEPICKLEPTGCPYGDSIPMDMCDKFAPQPEVPTGTAEKQQAIEEHSKPFQEECGK